MHSSPQFTVALFEGKFLQWRQLFSGEIIREAIIQDAIILGEIFLGGNCPRTYVQVFF